MKTSLSYSAISKSLRLCVLLACLTVTVSLYAAKGDSKTKKGVVLKFSGFDFKGINNFSLYSKPGFLYKGSFSTVEKAPQNTYMNSVVTFQRGNTTYIYPYQHKVSVPLFKTPAAVNR